MKASLSLFHENLKKTVFYELSEFENNQKQSKFLYIFNMLAAE